MSTQPSMVMHWNTVRMAKRMLSKLVMPKLGPVQYSLHSVPLGQILAGGSWPQDQSAAFSPGKQRHTKERGQVVTWHVQLHFSISFRFVQIYTVVFKDLLYLKLYFKFPFAILTAAGTMFDNGNRLLDSTRSNKVWTDLFSIQRSRASAEM